MTRVWHDISLTAEILDYSFTSAVSDRCHVERTSLLFTAVKSHLNERQVGPQFFHGTLRENCLIVVVTADSTVCKSKETFGSPKRSHNRQMALTIAFEFTKYRKEQTLLDISDHSYGRNLPTIKDIRPVYLFSETK